MLVKILNFFSNLWSAVPGEVICGSVRTTHSRTFFCGSDKGLLQRYEGSGLFTYMRSTLIATIFGMTGGVAILLADVPVVKILPATSAHEYGAPLVPQIEEEVGVPEPLDHYSVAQAKTKTEKHAPRRHAYVARRPNFFEKLFVSFSNLQKHQSAKSSRKQ